MSSYKNIKWFIVLILFILGFYFLNHMKIQLNDQNNTKLKIHNAGEWLINSVYVNGNWAYINETYEWCFYRDGFFIIENVTINEQHNHGIIIANTQEPFIIRNCTIHNSVAGEDSAAIKFISVKKGKILGNNLSRNNGNGILTTMSKNITIQHNLINDNGENGLLIGNSDNFTISNNQVNENGEFGMLFDAFYGGGVISAILDHIVFKNEISYNSLSGVKFIIGKNCTIEENEIHSNVVYGVHLDFWCSDNIITKNYIIYKQGCIYDKEGRSHIFNNNCVLDPSIAASIPGFNPYLLIIIIFTLVMTNSVYLFRRNRFSSI